MKNKSSKKKGKKEKEILNSNIPSWVLDEGNERETPYTEEELDLFVEGFIESNMDTNMLKDLIDKFGEEKARQIIKDGFIAQDPNSQIKRKIN